MRPWAASLPLLVPSNWHHAGSFQADTLLQTI
jgi:hypothetical protein